MKAFTFFTLVLEVAACIYLFFHIFWLAAAIITALIMAAELTTANLGFTLERIAYLERRIDDLERKAK
jgi:hypothetical protein